MVKSILDFLSEKAVLGLLGIIMSGIVSLYWIGEKELLDMRLHFLQNKQEHCSERIIVIEINDFTIEKLNERYGRYRPIPLDYLAKIIDSVSSYDGS